MTGLHLHNITKTYGTIRALERVSLEVSPGEIVAVLGPSGCGKSTLLRLIAGLEKPDDGQIAWNGASLDNVAPDKRGFGLMFQDLALFPHLNVFDNVAFGLRMARWPESQIRGRVQEVLELVGLPGFERRDVNLLSGGEGQRVALARALSPSPKLVMLDEPLGSLDRALRERLVIDLRHVLLHSKQTAIYVTHDQEEAYVIADRIVLMNAGKVEQAGSPQEIYSRPTSVFAARFLGFNNLIPAEAIRDGGQAYAKTPLGIFPIQDVQKEKFFLLVRPDAVSLEPVSQCKIIGEVKEISFRGIYLQVIVAVAGLRLVFQLPGMQRSPAVGEQVCLHFEANRALQILLE